MFRRIAVLSAIILALLPASPARADLFAGACLLDLELNLPATVSPDSVTPYTFEILSGTCAVGSPGHELQTTTGGSGSGISLSKCGNGAGIGPWDQWFSDLTPAHATHVFSGTWGAGQIVVTNLLESPNFQSVIYTMPHPLAPLTAVGPAECALSTSSSIMLLGVQVFEDPTLP